MKQTRFLIFITSILFLVSCAQEHKELFPNGNIKTIYKIVKGQKTGIAIEFNVSGDTSAIYNYNNGLLDGKQIIFGNDSSFFTKRILNYQDGKLHGEGLEYVNNSLRFRWNYENDLKQGDFYGYFNSGSLKYIGYFIEDRMCYFIELNEFGDTLNIDKSIRYNVIEQNTKDREFKFKIDLGKKVKPSDSLELLYALYKVNDSDTTKITTQRFESIMSMNEQISIPLHLKDTGLYYYKIAIPTIQNMQESHIIYDLPFYLNDSSVKKIENNNEQIPLIARF